MSLRIERPRASDSLVHNVFVFTLFNVLLFPFRRVFESIFCKIARITISQARSSTFSLLYKHCWSSTARFCDPPMTTSAVPSEKLEREAISVYFLKIPPEPVERKLETETDFCVLGEEHILHAFQSPRALAAKPRVGAAHLLLRVHKEISVEVCAQIK